MGKDNPDASGLVLDALVEAQGRGFIGPGDLGPHLSHSVGFESSLAGVRKSGLNRADRVADLGSGGGLPGLVLAARFRGVRFTLIEGSTSRADFLRAAVDRCGLSDAVEVVDQRAELVGHSPNHRGTYTVVVTRLLGSPPEVAELGAPLLAVGGHLVVSEPPRRAGAGRWPPDGLATVGLRPASLEPGYAVLEQFSACPEQYPRRTGVPRKRPIF